ncbi:MAG: hypothetical protein ACK4P2_02380 [Hyphomonas sp.]
MFRILTLSVCVFVIASCNQGGGSAIEPARWATEDGAFEVVLPAGWKIGDTKIDVTTREDSPSYEVGVTPNRHQADSIPSCFFWIQDLRALTPEKLSLEIDTSIEETLAMLENARREGSLEYLSPRGLTSYAEAAVEVVCTNLEGCVSASVEGFSIESRQDSSIEASWMWRYDIGGRGAFNQFVIAERYAAEDHMGLRLCLFNAYADRARYGSGDLATLRAAMDF